MALFSRALAAALTVVACLVAGPVLAREAPPKQAVQPDYSWQDKIPHSTGTVTLPGGDASLVLGDDFYFIDAEGARKILVDGWNNPPQAADGVLGMVFPKRFKPMDDGNWGAVITFDEIGWVSDEDAATTDYDKLLTQLRQGEDAANAERQKQGYPAITLVGWAERPSYFKGTHVAIWARELAFNGAPQHGLNYDIRVLGRTGVLSLNMVGAMTDLGEFHSVADTIARTVAFKPGSAYADYKPGVDKSAGIGIAGLIAGGVGVAAVKKLGLLGIILAFGKKFIILLVAGLGGVVAWFRKLFGGGKTVSVGGGASTPRPSLFDPPQDREPEPPPAGSSGRDIVT